MDIKKSEKKIRRASRVYTLSISNEITPDRQMSGQKDAQTPLSALCTSCDGHLYQVSLTPLYTFRDMLWASFLLQKL